VAAAHRIYAITGLQYSDHTRPSSLKLNGPEISTETTAPCASASHTPPILPKSTLVPHCYTLYIPSAPFIQSLFSFFPSYPSLSSSLEGTFFIFFSLSQKMSNVNKMKKKTSSHLIYFINIEPQPVLVQQSSRHSTYFQSYHRIPSSPTTTSSLLSFQTSNSL
jgi:hypothetical protein